jgi:sigma-B regulation protein RsbU (phosphoserine phosphatase)
MTALPLLERQTAPRLAAPTLYTTPSPFRINESPANTFAYLALISELQNKMAALLSERDALLGTVQTLQHGVKEAARIQQDSMSLLPTLDDAKLELLYQPLDGVSGDAFDVQDLGDGKVGIGLIDASDHGVPAAILTSRLLTAMRITQNDLAANAAQNSSDVLDSSDVLSAVQSQLAGMDLSQCEFAAGLHAVYDAETRTLSFARAGAPYPIRIAADGVVTALVSNGPIMGAIDNACFETMSVQLDPGDTVLFATDGLEALLAADGVSSDAPECALSTWFEKHGETPIATLFGELRKRLRETPRHAWHADDVTAISLHIAS